MGIEVHPYISEREVPNIGSFSALKERVSSPNTHNAEEDFLENSDSNFTD